MKLLKLGIYYERYLADFYRANPALADAPYEAAHAALLSDCFGSSDFWTVALSKRGYETVEIVANARPLQMRWAAEHGLAVDDSQWLFDISTAQICEFAPEVVIVADYSTFTAAFVRNLRERCPSIRLVAGWCGAPYQDPNVFREWDIVLSCVPELVSEFRALGHVSQHLHHSFDPRILARLDLDAKPICDFSFVGSIVKGGRFHNERDVILSSLLEASPLEIWSEAIPTEAGIGLPKKPPAPQPGVFSSMARRLRGGARLFGGASHDAPIDRERLHPPVFGRSMFQTLRQSRVSLNTHIDVAAQSASNMRLFEITGVGSCMMTDWKPNLHELFDDDEVVTYRTPAECADKVRYLLRNAKARNRIAAAGQKRTLRDHCVDVRAIRLDEIIRRSL